MSRSPLDALPEWSWFLGLDLRTAALIIATLGIIHPMAYVYSCFLFRSYLSLTIWVLVGAWAGCSVGLFVGILRSIEMAVEAWIWFSFVFAVLMTVLMMLMLCDMCWRRFPAVCSVFVALFGALYYCLTFYFVFVVNSYRKREFSHHS